MCAIQHEVCGGLGWAGLFFLLSFLKYIQILHDVMKTKNTGSLRQCMLHKYTNFMTGLKWMVSCPLASLKLRTHMHPIKVVCMKQNLQENQGHT